MRISYASSAPWLSAVTSASSSAWENRHPSICRPTAVSATVVYSSLAQTSSFVVGVDPAASGKVPVGCLSKCFFSGRQRQEQCSRTVDEGSEAKVLIKGHRLVVLGVHQKRVDCRRRLYAPAGCVHQQRSSQAAALKLLVDGQTADSHRR